MAVEEKSNVRMTGVISIGIVLIGLLLLQLTYVVSSKVYEDSVCSSKSNCSQCISAGPQCAWCKIKDNNFTSHLRCGTVDRIKGLCPLDDIVNPNSTIRLIKDRKLSKPKTTVVASQIIQIRPQEVELKMRINGAKDLTVKFRQAEDYPVDLYFLMDMSYSMLDDKDKLARLGYLLGEQMGKITKDFRIGFGSFVDKPVGPFINTSPEKLISPCPGCAAPYGFINHMPLDKNITHFVNKVRDTQISGNLDGPEGVFDAMMQVVVCKKEIGWRNVSRKILLVATDAGFHFAGDGKLGGIVKPNDESCHLNNRGIYTESENMDYPSISQIKNKVVENNINVIFAVTAGMEDIYTELQTRIVGSYTGQLAANSDNIVDLIKDLYSKITATVELKDTAPNNYVQLKYYSNCNTNLMTETNKCSNITVGQEVEFKVRIEAVACPTDAHDKRIEFKISPVGLSDTLVVNLEPICDCDCEGEKQQEINSSMCSDVGTYLCGVCICPEDKSGQFCQCKNAEAGNEIEKCIEKSNSTDVCSGKGICTCGKCDCEAHSGKNSYGQYCQYEKVKCKSSDGKICGGRGTCDVKDGSCNCTSGWTGNACQCAPDDTCVSDNDGTICNGQGNCVCGRCNCNDGFSGKHCLNTPAGNCEKSKECAQCNLDLIQGAVSNCSNCLIGFEIVDKAEVKSDGENLCIFKDDDSCNVIYVYVESKDGQDTPPMSRIQRTKECPEPVNVALIAGSVSGAIVAIGLALLLLWKILTSIYDRREYAKFVQDIDKAKWQREVNPMYVPTVSTFANPMYSADHD